MLNRIQTRRAFVVSMLLGACVIAFQGSLISETLAKAKRGKSTKGPKATKAPADDFKNLKPGGFAWHPERSPEGPVAIIVSVPKQRAFVYRNGILIGVSTCSTGKKGYDTPLGVFTILEKAKEHYSSEFDDAPMPHMERLTWGGVALHAGKLPGYPVSHGCVRLPPKFAESLYAVTQVGTPVIIAGDYTDPQSVKDPGPILGSDAKQALDAKSGKKKGGGGGKNAVTSILVSHLCAAERRHRRGGRRQYRRPVEAARLQCVCLAGRRPEGFELGGHGVPCRWRRGDSAEHGRARTDQRLDRCDGGDQHEH